MRRLACFSSAAIVFSFAAASAQESADVEGLRSKQEAVALFQRVFARDATKIEPCTFASDWLNYPVPEDVAQKYFALKAHAELSPLQHPETPAEIMDPKSALKGAFCDHAETAKREAARKDEFEQISRGKDSREERDTISWQFSFPIFKEDFSVASLVVISHQSKLFRSPDGVLRQSPFDRGAVETYGKQNGQWTQIDSEELFTAE